VHHSVQLLRCGGDGGFAGGGGSNGGDGGGGSNGGGDGGQFEGET